ncbi:Zn-ribbon domain-containing OB-fold protein [Novosphingobium malaysiense]|nr:zinc ribbon domain-containing protein [Novosphingobium malaysiense]
MLPQLDQDNRDFWTGGEHGELRIRKCGDCETYIHPPRPVCHKCLSDNVVAAAVSGLGTVDTCVINYQQWMPDMPVPFVVARIALDDAPGIYVTSNVIGCPVESVQLGDRVRVTFLNQEEVWIPLFEKIGSDDGPEGN